MTSELRNIYLAYYNKLGTKTKEKFYNKICLKCKELNIELPTIDNLIDCLDKNNFWYLIYYDSFD